MSSLYSPKSKNLSLAWAEVFLELMRKGQDELTPTIITVTEFSDGIPNEHTSIRQRLDQELISKGEQNSHTVANTIFPVSLWNPSIQDNGKHVFERYEKIWHKIYKDKKNKRGVYFQRLTAFCPKGSDQHQPINQLQHIIETYQNDNHRRSALQAAIFDPTHDHTHSRQRGFPCLQQVSFTPVGTNGLCVTGYYAMQYQFERAYGNYLGLCHLGRFMAAQIGLSLVQMTCVAAVAKRGGYTKCDLRALEHDTKILNDSVKGAA